jgi:oxygen-independent coproporphyrinogen III oxidase
MKPATHFAVNPDASSAVTFDAELLRRYGVQGPRYTSYPPATQFQSDFGAADFRAQALIANADPSPRQLSLYVHVPYCFSPCFYCGCNRVITRDVSKGGPYAQRLTQEIERVANLFVGRELVQLHFGGGTPNFLTLTDLSTVMRSVQRHFRITADRSRDVSIEIDPRFIDADTIASYAALGFNRASLGVQDFDPVVQQAVNRVQSVEQTLSVIGACRASGFQSINIDLIYGLPKQSLTGFAKTLATVIDTRPERLAIYGYAHMPSMFKAQRQIDAQDLPSAELKIALLQLAIEKLTAAGYRHIGMDHFALPDDELARAQSEGTLHRNFMGYTTHAQTDLVGVGVSAISHVGDSFSQNPRDLAAWEVAIDQGNLPIWRGKRLDADDCLRAEIIQQLMCNGIVDIAAIERQFDIRFAEYFAKELLALQKLVADGLVEMDPQSIRATPRGRLLLRLAAMCFDRYLPTDATNALQANAHQASTTSSKPLHSSVV